jgi:hypothetical protein
MRDRLELLIEEISSSRLHDKYSRMPRRRYGDIINALEKDGELGTHIANTLINTEAVCHGAPLSAS